jgi:hypothetical protein
MLTCDLSRLRSLILDERPLLIGQRLQVCNDLPHELRQLRRIEQTGVVGVRVRRIGVLNGKGEFGQSLSVSKCEK